MGKSAPEPPDPQETAAASTSTNVGTAIANAFLGNANQVTPEGSLTYDQTGSYKWNDPYTGQTYDVPTFTATQTYSPEQQAARDAALAAQTNLNKFAADQSDKLSGYLDTPMDLSNDAVESRLFELGRARLDPMFAERQQALDAKLANQGITPGSEAYNRAQAANYQQENDAYNQLLLSGRGQAVQEALTQRNQPINEIGALLGTGQVSQPNFVGMNQSTIPTTDVAGLINENYNQRLGIWNQQNAQTQNILGGLFGLGANLIASDRRLKTDIKKIGTADNGLPIYAYRYVTGGPVMIGFMADEVAELHPEAVGDIGGGYLGVDYGKAVL